MARGENSTLEAGALSNNSGAAGAPASAGVPTGTPAAANSRAASIPPASWVSGEMVQTKLQKMGFWRRACSLPAMAAPSSIWARASRALHGADLSARVRIGRASRETAELGEAFNSMAEALESRTNQLRETSAALQKAYTEAAEKNRAYLVIILLSRVITKLGELKEITTDVIETWIDYKMKNEVLALDLRPHPWEFMLYFDI